MKLEIYEKQTGQLLFESENDHVYQFLMCAHIGDCIKLGDRRTQHYSQAFGDTPAMNRIGTIVDRTFDLVERRLIISIVIKET